MEGKVFVKLTLLVEVREQLRKVCAIAEMRPARVVSALVLAAARLLSYGFSWFDLILYINVSPSAVLALVEIAQGEAYPPDVAVWLLTNAAAGAVRRGMEFGDVIRALTTLSPTAEVPQSVTTDVTDRLTDRPCGGGFA